MHERVKAPCTRVGVKQARCWMTSSYGGVRGHGRRGDKASALRARTNATVDRSALEAAGMTKGVMDADKAANR